MLKILFNLLKLVAGSLIMIAAAVGIFLNFHDGMFLFLDLLLLLLGLFLFFGPIRQPACSTARPKRKKPN